MDKCAAYEAMRDFIIEVYDGLQSGELTTKDTNELIQSGRENMKMLKEKSMKLQEVIF